MNIAHHYLEISPLTPESFEPFGNLLEPTGPSVDNNDLLNMGYAKMSDNIPSERLGAFDVLDYWGNIASITQEPMRLGYLRPKLRPLVVSWFERHVRGTQSFIPLGGKQSIMVVAGPSQIENPEDLPNLASARAFHLNGSIGINLHPGTWHWTPFPLEHNADFIILVRINAKDDDLNFVDLEAKLSARLEVKQPK